MGLFDTMSTAEDVKESGDSLGGGFEPVNSAIYDAVIKLAYITFAPSEAMALNLVCLLPNGKTVKQQLWITSGKAKGKKNFYVGKDGDKQYLPGYNQANALCLLTVGKPLAQLKETAKVIELYDPKIKGMAPTKVDVLEDLTDQEIIIGILKQITNVNVKDPVTQKYVPTAKTREENEIDKFFRKRDGLTVVEIKAHKTEPGFQLQWAERWTDKIKDKTVEVKTNVQSGSPAAEKAADAATTTAAQEGTNLFA